MRPGLITNALQAFPQYQPQDRMQQAGQAMLFQVNALALQQAKQQMARDAQFQNALASDPTAYFGEDGTPNYGALSQAALGAGDSARAMEFGKAGSEAAAKRVELQGKELDQAKQRLEVGGQLMAGVDTPDEFTQAMVGMAQMGIIRPERLQQIQERLNSGEQWTDIRDEFVSRSVSALDQLKRADATEERTYQRGQDKFKNNIELAKLRQKEREIDRTMKDAKRKGDIDIAKMEIGLAKDFQKESGVFVDTRNAAMRALDALEDADTSAIFSQAAITAFNKVLDPGSVVRESEVGMTMKAQGMWEQAETYLRSIKKGNTLSPKQKQDMARIINMAYSASESAQTKLENVYRDRAEYYGMRPENVIQDYRPEMSGGAEQQKTMGEDIAPMTNAPAPAQSQPASTRKGRRDAKASPSIDDLVSKYAD